MNKLFEKKMKVNSWGKPINTEIVHGAKPKLLKIMVVWLFDLKWKVCQEGAGVIK